ncbi:unnamed protein product [Calicophoron daubneyi]|uniref:Ig-like domain-containing protein n=1 Tax=Calicophoron daubneyi TaxID=300641 RepID=A0AAV2TC32_CALDB
MPLHVILCFLGFVCVIRASSNVSVIGSITPDVYILHADGNQKRLEHVALTYNSHVTLICRTLSRNENLMWQYSVFDSREFKPVTPSEYLSIEDNGRGETELKLTNIQFSMAGTYQCSNQLASREINIHVYGILAAIGGSARVIKKHELAGNVQFETNFLDQKTLPTAACQFRVGRYGIKYTSIRWRGGRYKTDPQLYEVTFSADEMNGFIWSNLTIIRPSADQALYGKYHCQFNVISGSTESAEVEINIPPIIKRPDRAATHYSGKQFGYTCDIVAYPPISEPISWSRDSQPILINARGQPYVPDYDWADRVRFETQNLPNDRLVFDPIAPEDRAVYSCFVVSPMGNTTGAMFLRVKDRWAVLWPFIGILLEVAVLFIVIVIYEIRRRREARREKESEMGLNGTNKNPSFQFGGDGAGDDVMLRQRFGRT